MPKVVDPLSGLSPEKRKRVEELEAECDRILEKLFENLEDAKQFAELSAKLRNTEIDIVRLTGEKIIDYSF